MIARANGARPVVLVLVKSYEPGFRSGGPARSTVGLVHHLGDAVDFRIITRDRDTGVTQPYPGVAVDRWQRVGNASVFYASPRTLRTGVPLSLLRTVPFDVLHINSFFNPRFSLKPLVLRRLGLLTAPIVAAPRGEFAPAALAIRPLRKRAWLALGRALGLFRHVTWQASSDAEADQIRRHLGPVSVHVARNLSAATCAPVGSRVSRTPGRLRIAFLSRVARMKNLDGALRIVARAEHPVHFDIHGPCEDPAYWAECRALIAALPPHVTAAYRGVVPHADVQDTLAGYDLLFLPTRGENFGHVILEALAAGCPVLISDRTPWRSLAAQRAGWDVPLEDEAAFLRVLHDVATMDDEAWREWSDGARSLAARALDDGSARRDHLAILAGAGA